MGEIDVAAIRERAPLRTSGIPSHVVITLAERDALLAAVEERDRLRGELAAVNAFRAEPLAGVRALIGEDEDMDDEAVMGGVVAILLTRQATARRLREEKAKNTALAAYARRLRDALDEIRDLIAGYVDVVDGDEGEQHANKAMVAQMLCDELLAKPMPGEPVTAGGGDGG